MKHRYAVIVLFALIIASNLSCIRSYTSTSRQVDADMNRALALALEEQQSNVISQDTIRAFNSHLQIAELRGKATLAIDTRRQSFRAYARCSKATVFSLSDQRPAAILWLITALWAIFAFRKPYPDRENLRGALTGLGGLTYSDADSRFYAADGNQVRLTPMQHQLMVMFFQSPTHSLTKAEICSALWPNKPDASETLYALISRLKPVIEQHSALKIVSDRSKAYQLETSEI